MGIAERKVRDREEREQRITAAARTMSEAEGWPAVTIRRLADAIEYSQPVLYSHFENRDAIVAAVALEGFAELGAGLAAAAEHASTARDRVGAAANAYLDFAVANPAVYEAMFVLPAGLLFAHAQTRPELREAFAALRAVVAPGPRSETATEVLWAALHGLAALERTDRVRPEAHAERVDLLVAALSRPGPTAAA